MSRLTIIIPFLHDARTAAFEETLASVLLHRLPDFEILVANGSGYSDPWNTNGEGVVFVASNSSNPVDLINEAVRRSHGKIIHILYPGTEVTDSWTSSVFPEFENPDVGIVIPNVFDRRKAKRVFSLGISYERAGTLRTIRRSQWSKTSHKTIVPHVSAVFFRKSVLERIGLFDPSFLPQISYVDAALRIAMHKAQTVVDQSCRITVRPNQLPVMTPFTWGIQIERLYFRWLGRHHSIGSLFRHLGSLFVDAWRHFPRLKGLKLLFGRLLGLLSFGDVLLLFRERKHASLSCDDQDRAVESEWSGKAVAFDSGTSDVPKKKKTA